MNVSKTVLASIAFKVINTLRINDHNSYLSVVGSDMENHIISSISKSKIILNNSGLASIKGSAVSKSPGSVSNAGAAVNDWAGGQAHV